MKNNLIIAVALLLMTFANCLSAQDWPQYLGPDRNSISNEKGLLRSWPETGPEVMWTAAIGIGYGGPVVKEGKVYLLDRDDKVGDNLRCFDLSSGKELWNFAYAAPGAVMFPGSRSVPTIDGNYVYSCGPYGDLYCIDLTTQKSVWNKNVWKDMEICLSLRLRHRKPGWLHITKQQAKWCGKQPIWATKPMSVLQL